MQSVETLNEGLKRGYTLTIPAREIDAAVDAEVKRVAPQVRMPGFRPGKVPTNLIRKMHGPAMRQDALNKAVQNGVQSLIAEQKLRPAMQPAVELDGYQEGGDVTLSVSLEVLPQVPVPQIEGLKLERLTVPVEESAVEAQLAELVGQNKQYEDAPEGRAAETGDQVVMDFAGSVDGTPFEGGTGEGMAIVIGSGRLIPGFEDQLIGAKAGESRTVSVTFPADYQAEELKGKAATFEIKVTAVKIAAEGQADDAFAKSLGLEGIDQLRGLIRQRAEGETNGLTRTHMKRKLLDQLADRHAFDVPPSMVQAEFDQIWRQLEHEATHEADPEAARAELENDRADYLKIAERRVRLGLLLSEIGQQNGVEVSQPEMQRLIGQAAQQYQQADRQRFMEYIQNEPMAAAQLRAPLFEDKVVDFLFGKAEITERPVSREELEREIEKDAEAFGDGSHVHEHAHDHNHDHAHDHGHVHGPDCDHGHVHEAAPAPAAKKPRARKAAAAAAAATEEAAAAPAASDGGEAAEAKPARKPRAKKPKAEEPQEA